MNNRFLSLDALRGLAIIGMVLSGSIAYNGVLPAWMYHAQVPPPEYRFNPHLPGITWVDLVFPFFLFAMGVAIPLAFARRALPQTWREYAQTGWMVLHRGLLLAFFAIFTQHIRTYALASGDPAWQRCLVGVIGFVLLFGVLMRFPKQYIKTPLQAALMQWLGLALCVLLMTMLSYPPHPTFGTSWSVYRSDIILLVLSNVAVIGTIVWLATRGNQMLRLGLLGFFLALRLAQPQPDFSDSWQHWLWFATPADWLFKVYYLQYLFIVLPGTVVGDIIVASMQQHSGAPEPESRLPKAQRSVLIAQVLLVVVLTLVNLVGLFTRALVLNLVLNCALLVLGWILFRSRERESATAAVPALHQTLYYWGTYWLLLGLFFEAFEGGIKKDKSTLSYYFLTTGLAILWLTALSVMLDRLKILKGFRAIIANGQNPMIAYVAAGMIVLPLLSLSGAEAWFNEVFGATPLLAFLRGVIITTTVVLITFFCTRRGWFWRT
jgi:predicted acyltransferase